MQHIDRSRARSLYVGSAWEGAALGGIGATVLRNLLRKRWEEQLEDLLQEGKAIARHTPRGPIFSVSSVPENFQSTAVRLQKRLALLERLRGWRAPVAGAGLGAASMMPIVWAVLKYRRRRRK